MGMMLPYVRIEPPFLWTCPYCGRDATITEPNYTSGFSNLGLYLEGTEYGNFGFVYDAVSCPNSRCRKVAFFISLHKVIRTKVEYEPGDCLRTWKLLPESEAKPQPDCIPAPIVQDYYEACRIKDLSAKASATLSRRCLQSMIRDFWKVEVKGKRTLWDEIKAIKGKVDASTWKAIDGIRKVGKVGAHMEKDVNLIIDVEPEEAQVLIGLIEMLFKEWYVDRHEREQRVAQMIELGEQKQQEMDAAKEQAAEPAKEKTSEPPPEKG
jgi:hypothetical protein